MNLNALPILAMMILCAAALCHAQTPHPHGQHTPLERDYSAYPIDSRKPCHICARPCDPKAIPLVNLPGLRGRPHIDQGIGGCTCGKKYPAKNPMTSWNWSLPFSAVREDKHPNFSAWLDDPCRPRLTSGYDRLGDFRLINYRRSDDGYCGMGRDPYGCLGESKQLESRVRGLQFRQPGEPVFGSPNTAARTIPRPQRQPQPTVSPRPRVSGGGYNLDAYRNSNRR